MAAVSDQKIARKDFLDGQEVPIGPSSLTGERGHTFGAAGNLHAMAFGKQKHEIAGLPIKEKYDLVIAGAGLSGLSTAFFYRQRFGPDKKILIMDPLEDFGGHAKRNEFTVDKTLLLGYGGSESLQSPKTNFTDVTRKLMEALGVVPDRFDSKGYFHRNKFPGLGLSRASFFDGSKFSKDTLVTGDPTDWVADDIGPQQRNAKSIQDFIGGFPISDAAKQQLVRLYTDRSLTLAAEYPTVEAREDYLSKISYGDFLRKHWALSDEALSYFHNRTLDFFGLSPDNIAALDAHHYAYPGMQGMSLPVNEEAAGELEEPYIYHFPDGNASIARLLVRSLIPHASKGNTMEDIVLAPFDYKQLDLATNTVRIRLNSSVVHVKNDAGHVLIGYVDESKQFSVVQATHCTLACFNMVIPYIFPELPAPQAESLRQNVKVPIVYTNVAVRNWQPWVKLGVHDIYGVNSFHSRVKLDYPVSIGGYQHAADPSQPTLIHMVHIPVVDGIKDAATALRMARKTFFQKKFEVYEEAIRHDLTHMLGPAGFDAARDIVGITVNRWSHGYSWAPNSLSHDSAKTAEFIAAGRKPVGHVTIACADAAWSPYAHSAIDEAFRAVQEL